MPKWCIQWSFTFGTTKFLSVSTFLGSLIGPLTTPWYLHSWLEWQQLASLFYTGFVCEKVILIIDIKENVNSDHGFTKTYFPELKLFHIREESFSPNVEMCPIEKYFKCQTEKKPLLKIYLIHCTLLLSLVLLNLFSSPLSKMG